MTDTTSSHVTELINSEYISPVVLQGAMNAAVCMPYMHVEDLRGKATGVCSFTQEYVATISGAASTISDGSGVTAAAWDPTQTQVTASQLAYSVVLTDIAVEDNIFGAGLFDRVAARCIRELAVSFDDDIAALFPSLSCSSVGTTNTDLSIANMVSAHHAVKRAGFPHGIGQGVYILHGQQALDLDKAQAATTATSHAQYFVPNTAAGSDPNLLGVFQGNPVVATDNCDNSGALDVVGAYLINGRLVPDMAPIGVVIARDFRLEEDRDISNFKTTLVASCRFGAGIINGYAGCPIITGAS